MQRDYIAGFWEIVTGGFQQGSTGCIHYATRPTGGLFRNLRHKLYLYTHETERALVCVRELQGGEDS